MISKKRKVGRYEVDETAYLEATSYESQHPGDPWLKHRLPSGDFAQWMHTWHYGTNEHGEKRPLVTWVPLPWVWDEKPDGHFMIAIANLGMMEKLPGDWGRMRNMRVKTDGSNVYYALLHHPGAGALQEFLTALRKRHVRVEDVVAHLDQHNVLFRSDGNYRGEV